MKASDLLLLACLVLNVAANVWMLLRLYPRTNAMLERVFPRLKGQRTEDYVMVQSEQIRRVIH